MKHRTPTIVAILAAVGAALTLTACGGGGDEETPDPSFSCRSQRHSCG